MEIPARVLVERIARGIFGISSAAMRRNPRNRRLAARLFQREIAACALTVVFLSPSLLAQQSRSTAGAPPGWPVTGSMPGHGDAPPDATIDMQRPETDRADESCSMWAVAAAQGATVSAARLQVPGKAKGEYKKACGDLKGNRLSSAEDHLHKAVQEYPQYAAAWVLLGQVLAAERRIENARGACSRASSVDSHYAPAYLCLAEVAAQQEQWNDSLELANRALAIVPARDVYGYFYSAMAQFHLSQLPAAERNALQTIEADHLHRVPQAHLLLAQIYGAKHDLYGAANELRAYLKVAPNSPDSAGVRKSLAELESHTPK